MKKFSLGDEVQLLDSKEKGIIIKIQGELLTIDLDGFEYEVTVNDVVLTQSASTNAVPNLKVETTEELSEGFYILLDSEQHWITVYLLNYTNSFLHFVVNHNHKKLEYIKDGVIEPFKSQKLKMVSSDNLITEAKFQIQLLLCYKNSPEKNQFLALQFAPNNKIFNRKPQFIKHLQKEVIVYPLQIFEESTKERPQIPIYYKEKREAIFSDLCLELETEKVLDLHLDKLTDKPHTIQEHLRLSFQLKKAEEFLYQAISQKCKRVIFIHGGGKGKLKEELIALLKNHPNVKTYGTADIQKYGLGATYFELIT